TFDRAPHCRGSRRHHYRREPPYWGRAVLFELHCGPVRERKAGQLGSGSRTMRAGSVLASAPARPAGMITRSPPFVAASAPAPRAPLLRPRPVLAAAEHQEAALDAQHIGAHEIDFPAVGLAVLRIVDLAFPAVARGLHRQEDLRAHDRVVALARVRIVLVEPRL